jgi:hypothetical protein
MLHFLDFIKERSEEAVVGFFGCDFTLTGVGLLPSVFLNVCVYDVADCFCVGYDWDFRPAVAFYCCPFLRGFSGDYLNLLAQSYLLT